jgi:hypothetical protein
MTKMTAVSDDNFGLWNIDGPEERAFFEHVQSQSIATICKRCERPVRLMPSKTVCASCISAIECGAPVSMNEYDHAQPTMPGAASATAALRLRSAALSPGEAVAEMSEWKRKGKPSRRHRPPSAPQFGL